MIAIHFFAVKDPPIEQCCNDPGGTESRAMLQTWSGRVQWMTL